MYNRSLVLALFGLVYVDRSALQHLLILAYLVSWTCSFCVCLVCVCVCFLLFEEFRGIEGSTHSGYHFIQSWITLSLSPFFTLICWFTFWFYKAKSETNFYPWVFFHFCSLRTGESLLILFAMDDFLEF